tara:strand:- start:222 stop:671 length:450 start_codon:yes stop_codon:yes gene_type:complete
MDQKTIHNLIWAPIFLIGVVSLAFGFIWILHPEPWLLDQAANEALLQTSFNELFLDDANKFLPSYLIVIYRFLGLWLITIGLLVLSYVKITKLGTKQARVLIHSTLFITLISMCYLIFKHLSSSPLIPTLYVFTLLLGLSVYFSRQITL